MKPAPRLSDKALGGHIRKIRRIRSIAACFWIAGLFLTPRDAEACSCVDWSRVGAVEARKAFLEDLRRAEVAVSAKVVAVSDLETLVTVSRVLKGQAPKNMKIFQRPDQVQTQRQGDQVVIAGSMDCRPSLRRQTEYLVLLFRQPDGTLDSERCTVWSDAEREQRLPWIGSVRH
jgi:hypothetical protein